MAYSTGSSFATPAKEHTNDTTLTVKKNIYFDISILVR